MSSIATGSEFSDDNYSLGPVKVSTINFVDLAGSERGSYSAHEGNADRIRQTEVRHFYSILFAFTQISVENLVCVSIYVFLRKSTATGLM